jgi:hypothetical protein
LSELTEERPTRIDEIALVCSNCHCMLHKRRPWLGIQELSAIIAGSVRQVPDTPAQSLDSIRHGFERLEG